MSKRQKTSHKSSKIAAKRSKRPDVKEDHEIEVLKEQDIGSAQKKGLSIYDLCRPFETCVSFCAIYHSLGA